MIEEAIKKLTEAVEANTVALNAILASAGPAPVAAPAAEDPKPAKKKPLVEVKTKLEVVEPEPAAETPAAETPAAETPAAETPEEPKHTLREAIDASKNYLNNGGSKDTLAELRGKFGVKTVAELPADKIDAYMAELAKL